MHSFIIRSEIIQLTNFLINQIAEMNISSIMCFPLITNKIKNYYKKDEEEKW